MESCCFGAVSDGECHKTSYVRKTGLKNLCKVSEEERQVLFWRAGMKEQATGAEQLKVCHHHYAKLGTIFQKKITKCCDLFKIHKQNVKGGRKISLDLANRLSKLGYECVPGWQLCRKCYQRAVDHESETAEVPDDAEGGSPDHGMDIEVTEIEEEVSMCHSRDLLNESFESIGISPIKTHSMPKHRRISYANEKLSKLELLKSLLRQRLVLRKAPLFQTKKCVQMRLWASFRKKPVILTGLLNKCVKNCHAKAPTFARKSKF